MVKQKTYTVMIVINGWVMVLMVKYNPTVASKGLCRNHNGIHFMIDVATAKLLLIYFVMLYMVI